MAAEDRERWNERYRAAAYDFTPNAWLVTLAERLRPASAGARALDLACGGGRNTLFLAELGYAVEAWDVSDAGLAILQAELERRTAAGGRLHVDVRRVDLERTRLPAARYRLVLNAFFLLRPLLAPLAAALRPGGLLVFETFVDFRDGRHPNVRPEFKLQPGELLKTHNSLDILEHVEDRTTGTARLLARRPSKLPGEGPPCDETESAPAAHTTRGARVSVGGADDGG